MGGYISDDDDVKPKSFMEGYREMGPKKFWSIMLAALAWCAIGIWLEIKLDFPDAYGFQCSGKGCLYVEVWHSFVLLRHHGGLEVALFAWLWTWPVALVGAVIYAVYRQLNPINSDEVE